MIERARPLLGTVVAIRIEDAPCIDYSPRAGARAIEAAFDAVAMIERLMSYQQPGSELSRLNRDAVRDAQPVNDHTFHVLRWAQRLNRDTGGRFEAVVPHGVQDGRRWQDLLLLPGHRVRYRKPLALDLSGIAKGYAVDLAIQVLRSHGVRAAVVNAGGDLRALGSTVQRIGLRVAGSSPQTAVIELSQGALATSTGAGGLTVSVAARRCLLADALTKVVLADLGRPTPATRAILTRFGARAWYHAPARGWQSVRAA